MNIVSELSTSLQSKISSCFYLATDVCMLLTIKYYPLLYATNFQRQLSSLLFHSQFLMFRVIRFGLHITKLKFQFHISQRVIKTQRILVLHTHTHIHTYFAIDFTLKKKRWGSEMVQEFEKFYLMSKSRPSFKFGTCQHGCLTVISSMCNWS